MLYTCTCIPKLNYCNCFCSNLELTSPTMFKTMEPLNIYLPILLVLMITSKVVNGSTTSPISMTGYCGDVVTNNVKFSGGLSGLLKLKYIDETVDFASNNNYNTFELGEYSVTITDIQISSDNTSACYTFEVNSTISEEMLDDTYILNITSGFNYCTVKPTILEAGPLSLEYDEDTGDLIVTSDLAGWKTENGNVILLVYDCKDNDSQSEYIINEVDNRILQGFFGNQADQHFQVCIQVSNNCGETDTFNITITGPESTTTTTTEGASCSTMRVKISFVLFVVVLIIHNAVGS